MKQSHREESNQQGARCLALLRLASTLGFFFSLFMAGVYLGMLTPDFVRPLVVYWSAVMLVMATGVFCVYSLSQSPKHALAVMLLVAGAAFAFGSATGLYPGLGMVGVAAQALGVVSFSLLVYELGRQRPGVGLEAAAGLIFLGTVFQILQSPLMEAAGLVILAVGFLLTSGRLVRL